MTPKEISTAALACRTHLRNPYVLMSSRRIQVTMRWPEEGGAQAPRLSRAVIAAKEFKPSRPTSSRGTTPRRLGRSALSPELMPELLQSLAAARRRINKVNHPAALR